MKLSAPDRAAFERELVRRRGFYEFVKLAWSQVESVPFVDNWHIGAKCEFLEAAQRRQIRKGVINEPPGCSKSLVVSTLYPPWCWTLEPTERFMCASYDPSLSERDARRHRDLVASEWYQARWPGVQIPAHAVKQVRNFENSRGGFRFSTSIQGKATGRHATQRILDDPIKPKDTMGGAEMTRKRLQQCVDFYRGTWSTRTVDIKRIVDLIIMQRLHDADLVGVLMAEGGWETLILPMRYEPRRACVVLGKKVDPRTEPGELLCPARFPELEVQKLERDLGNFASAQLQQDPVPATGGVFQQEWVRYWSPDGKIPDTVALPVCHMQVQSWDLAFKGEASSDPVVGQCWGVNGPNFYLLDQVTGRWDFGQTCDEVVAFSAKHPRAMSKYVEEKANGAAVMNALGKVLAGLEAVDPQGGKEARANAVSGLWRSGNVFLPHPTIAPWVTAFVTELLRFPKAPHDDQVDAMTQALSKLGQTNPLVAAMAALRKNRG